MRFVRFFSLDNNQFIKLEYQIDEQNVLVITKNEDNSLQAEIIRTEYQIRLNSANGTIEDSLFQSGQRLGLKR